MRASSFLTCEIRERSLRRETSHVSRREAYKLLVDVPVKNGSRMALPRGAIKVDFVPDLILGLHPCYLGVVFRQGCNNTETQRN